MDAFIQFFIEWGYAGMFISAFLAGTVLPFSSEAVLIACIGLGLDPVLSVAATAAGNILGGMTCIGIGRLGKKEWIEKYIKINKEQIDRASRFIHNRGACMALFSFLPVIGDAILIVLGLMRANFLVAVLFMAIGKSARYAILAGTALGVIQLFN